VPGSSHKNHAGRNDSPRDHERRYPAARPNSLQNHVAGQLEHNVSGKEHSRGKPVTRIAQTESRLNLKRRETNIDSIQVGDYVKKKQKGNEPPCDLGDDGSIQVNGGGIRCRISQEPHTECGDFSINRSVIRIKVQCGTQFR
jgi:hypothetical protein